MLNERASLAEKKYSGAGGDCHHSRVSHVENIFTHERNSHDVCASRRKPLDSLPPEDYSILFLTAIVHIEASARLKTVLCNKVQDRANYLSGPDEDARSGSNGRKLHPSSKHQTCEAVNVTAIGQL